MILKGKKVLIMGIRNKWSIAWGAAQSAYENGAEVIFTHNSMENEDKIKELISQIPNAKSFACDASSDESIKNCLENIKSEYGKIDGVLHSIAHANTDDLRNDFILTSRDGYAHACDVSAYSLVATARIAKEIDMLNEGASIVYLAVNLGKEGIRVNGISAGPIKTLSAKGIKDFGTILDVVEQKAPLHKNVTTKQVGDATSFLFSNLSSAITGEIIHVDNGFSIVGV